MFIPLKSETLQSLARFQGPSDPWYQAVVYRMKSALLFKCSSSTTTKLESALEHFISEKFPVGAKDDQGQTPLHRAASAPNHAAVTRLIYNGDAPVTAQDNDGRTPLHVAIQAIKDNISPETQGNFKQVIRQLTKNRLRVNEVDNEGNTAWKYAEGKNCTWIMELKDKRGLIEGSSIHKKELESMRELSAGSQYDASNKLEVILVEFFSDQDGGKTSEWLHPDEATVYELIYKERRGLQNILSRSRPSDVAGKRFQCRWIHLPANNASIKPPDSMIIANRGVRNNGSMLVSLNYFNIRFVIY